MSSQQAVVQYVYPHTAAPSFNLDYYINTHMAIVEKHWGSHGLLNWTITKGEEGTDYFVQVTTFWESLEAFEKVKTSEEISGDVVKFSTVKPTVRVGVVVGRSK